MLIPASSGNIGTRTIGVYFPHEATPHFTSHKERPAPLSSRVMGWRGTSDSGGLCSAVRGRGGAYESRWYGSQFLFDLVWFVFYRHCRSLASEDTFMKALRLWGRNVQC